MRFLFCQQLVERHSNLGKLECESAVNPQKSKEAYTFLGKGNVLSLNGLRLRYRGPDMCLPTGKRGVIRVVYSLYSEEKVSLLSPFLERIH